MTDPLVEQMRSILQLGNRANDSSQARVRRYSDADRSRVPFNLSLAEPDAGLSGDGTRCMPTPDEISHTYRPHSKGKEPVQVQRAAFGLPTEQHSCSRNPCALSKVFATPELLELVLSFLDTLDIVNMRRINQQWEAIIQQSPQLRLHFFNFAQWYRPGVDFQLLPLLVPGLSITRGDELDLGQWVSVSFTPEAARRIVPNPQPNKRVRSRSIFEGLRGGLGQKTEATKDNWPASNQMPTIDNTLRYEDLLVTQPPITGMQAFVYLPSTSNSSSSTATFPALEDEPAARAKLSCQAGITLGFLAETAQSIISSPAPAFPDVEEAKVVFKAIMSFTEPQENSKKRPITRTIVQLS